MSYTPKHLSATALNLFLAYPEAYYYKYVLQIKPTTKVENLVFGSAFHEGVAAIILDRDFVEPVWSYVRRQKEAKDLEEIYRDVLRMLRLYKKKGPWFDPLQVEVKNSVYLQHPTTGEKLPIPFVYKMDLITTDGMIVDHKTTSAELKEQGWQYRNQGIAYWMCYKQEFGENPRYFVENQAIKQKRNPRFVQKFYSYGLEEEVWFFNLCKEALWKMKMEEWYGKPKFKTYFPNPYKLLCQTNW